MIENFAEEDFVRETIENTERPEKIPCCDNISDYLDFIRKSSEYQRAIAKRHQETIKRFENVKESGDLPPSREEVAAIYEETFDFKQLFWNFEQDVLHLRFKPEKYLPEIRQKILGYFQSVNRFHGVFLENRSSADKIVQADQERRRMHNQVAQTLFEANLVPNFFVGRLVVRAFLVDKGLDSIYSARREDKSGFEEKNENKIPPRFTPERASELISQYLESNPQIDFDKDFCERSRYETMEANFAANKRGISD